MVMTNTDQTDPAPHGGMSRGELFSRSVGLVTAGAVWILMVPRHRDSRSCTRDVAGRSTEGSYDALDCAGQISPGLASIDPAIVPAHSCSSQ